MIYNFMKRSNTEAAYQSFPCFLPFLEERTTASKFKQSGNITQDCTLPQITENLAIVNEKIDVLTTRIQEQTIQG